MFGDPSQADPSRGRFPGENQTRQIQTRPKLLP